MPRPFSLPSLLLAGLAVAQSVPDPVAATLMRAGDNRPELERAWRDVPYGDRAALRFELEHLPERDATTLTAPFLLDDVRLANDVRSNVPWQLDDVLFVNYVLPYAQADETREAWRGDFTRRFLPRVLD
jgi:hypothetical protein